MINLRPVLMPDRPLCLRLLGGFQLTSADGETINIPRRKGVALLAFLAVTVGSVIARDKLASLLWGQSEQRQARQSLRQILRTLSQDLSNDGARILRLDGQMVSLDADHVRVDVLEFETLIARGDVKSLAAAAGLYRGEFLAELSTDEPDFEEWLGHSRSRFRDLAVQGLARLVEQCCVVGDIDLAVESANHVLRIDPFREDIHRRLMRMYLARGMRAAALAQYRECESILRRELGIAPDDKTLHLYNEVLSRREVLHTSGDGGHPLPTAATKQNPAPLLVGFDRKLTLLQHHLDHATREGARFVLVTGDAGAGKSALLERFCWGQGIPGLDDAAMVVARAHPAEQFLSFAIWKDLLNTRLLEHAGHQDPNSLLARRLTFLREGAGISVRRYRDPTTDSWQAFDAMVELFRIRSKEAVLTLIIEDIHFADDASLRLLFYLLRNLRHSPVLFIATVRPENMVGRNVLADILGDLDRDGQLHRIALHALKRGEVETLVRLLREKNTAAMVSRARLREIWKLSDGNPGVVVEAALATGDESAVPKGLHSELVSRLDGLDDTAKLLAATASVIGEMFEITLLAQAAGVNEEAALRGVEKLIAAGVLVSKGEVLRFSRGRFLLAQYRSLLPARRRRIHLTIARIIAEAPLGDPAGHFATLAHHYNAADRIVDALRNDVRLAQVQMRQRAHALAKGSFCRILKVLSARVNNSVEMRFEIEARLGLAEIEEITGNFGEALTEQSAPEIMTKEMPTAALRTRHLAALGRLNGVLGNDEIARDALRRAAGKGQADNGLWQPSDRILEFVHIVGGNAQATIDHMANVQKIARRHDLIVDEVTLSAVLCLLRALGGAADAAMAEAQVAVDGADRLGDSRLLAVGMHVRGVAQTWCGDAPGALDTFTKVIELATLSGDLPRLYLVYGYRGHAFAMTGRYAEAISELDTALRMADDLNFEFSRPLFQAWKAGVLTEMRGVDSTSALAAARAALKLAIAANRPWAYSVGLRALACALAHPDIRDFVGAERAIRDALAEQSTMGFEFECGRSLVAYARILHSAGEKQKSILQVRRAQKLFRRMKTMLNREAVRGLAKVLCSPSAVSS